MQPGDVVLAYEDRSTVMLWTVSLLGVLEVVVVHVLTARWPVVQWTLFAVGVLGMVAFLAWGLSLRQMPHVIRQGRLVLRSGRTHAVEVPLATLSAVRRHVVGEHPRILAVEGGRLVLSFMRDTNVELALDPPAEVQVKSGPVAVERVLFYANDAQGTVRTLREHATNPAG